jgi:hypothetical protein
MSATSDLTAVYYTANVIPERFSQEVRAHLVHAIGDAPIVSVSHKPISLGENIVVDLPRHHLSIYRQALIGAKAARTKYIALCEDDVLYSPEHFKHRAQPGTFAYNLGHWGLYTWEKESVFSWKGRRNLCNLICERDLFIEAMEERFAKHPDGNVDLGLWAEPGKYERQLGVTVRETEEFWTNPPNVVFSHETALAFGNLGKRKRLGELRATEIPYWGRATKIREMYKE